MTTCYQCNKGYDDETMTLMSDTNTYECESCWQTTGGDTLPSWNEYEICLVFDNYFIQGVGYGETKKQALRIWEATLDFDFPEPLETEITKTGELAD